MRTETEEVNYRRFKEKWIFTAILITIVVAQIILGFLALKQESPLALSGMMGLAMALAGYYVRGKTN
jgi:hypothetical protein